jgi:hypothetical protein
MPRCYREPTVTEALADPLIRLVMKADGVDVDELDAVLTRTAAELSRRRVRSVAAESHACGSDA